MIKTKLINQICDLRKYHSKYGVEITDDKLNKIISKAKNEARENYNKLKSPKTCSFKTYKTIWTIQKVDKYLAVLAFDMKQTEATLKVANAAKEYFEVLPFEEHSKLKLRIDKAKLSERKKVWKQEDLPIKKIESKFQKLTQARSRLVKSRGFGSYEEMMATRYKIPEMKLRNFKKNVNKAIQICNSHIKDKDLPDLFFSEYNRMCYVCQLDSFPIKNLDEAFDYFAKNNPKVKKFNKKINISLGESSQMTYKKETDTFEIEIAAKGNIRHRVLDLFHELAHVVYFLECFEKELNPYTTGSYITEKHAYKKVLETLEDLDKKLYNTYFSEFLHDIASVLYQIDIYNDPDQDFAKLYAVTINKCWKDVKQTKNPTYILDEYVVFKPLNNLPHAVAAMDVVI